MEQREPLPTATPVVGTPDRRYLWILSRTPRLDELTHHRLIYLVCFVHLVSLVSLVCLLSLVQPNTRDKPNQPNKPDRLADCFSIMLDTFGWTST